MANRKPGNHDVSMGKPATISKFDYNSQVMNMDMSPNNRQLPIDNTYTPGGKKVPMPPFHQIDRAND